MRRVWIAFAILAAALLVVPNSARAQSSTPDHPLLYKLEPGTVFQRGCFPPCMCPLMAETPMRGTFQLIPTQLGGTYDLYDVRNVRWKAVVAGVPTWITGSGTYMRGGSGIVPFHGLELDLTVGNEPPQHFSNGPGRIAANPDFPRIVISISIHREFCIDTVLRIDARPARRLHVGQDGLSWDSEPVASTYDVVMGDLGALVESGGGFDFATEACLASGCGETAIPFGVDPVAGRAFWFLVRPDGDSYDDADSGQVGSADAGIAASAAACP